ncbi:hypothetical protein F2Q70_00027510 [Brassica cretica]|uniref:Uncharacterized protein n=1 Tax=Brassica cretica TaxID=69181 RepID=A0A8S9LF13_BRACR|nr:hypothetical protein F2Q70_00027510 [Brassica cretica]
MVFGDINSIARVRLHDLMNFVLSTLPSMFPHLVAAFIAACISVTLSFAMFTTPGLDIVLLRRFGRLFLVSSLVSGFSGDGFRSPSLRLFSSSLASFSISVRY